MKNILLLILSISFLISCSSKEDEEKEKAKKELISMYKNDIEKYKRELKFLEIDVETWSDCINDNKNLPETIIECGRRWREAREIRDDKEKEINDLEKELLKIKQQ